MDQNRIWLLSDTVLHIHTQQACTVFGRCTYSQGQCRLHCSGISAQGPALFSTCPAFPYHCLLLTSQTQRVNIQTVIGAHTIRVANVVADHDDLLKQFRPIKMNKFCANIFLIRTTSNYFWASEVSKNQVFKSQFFSSSHASNQ